MSAPSTAYINQLVTCPPNKFYGRREVQPEVSLASTLELNLTPGRVIVLREAKGKGYWATTQVKVLSSEIFLIIEADTFHGGGKQQK